MRLPILMTLAIGLIVGCASLTAPDSPAQALAYADSQFAALVHTAADLREQGAIDAQSAEEIDALIQRGDGALASAWRALGDDKPDTAMDYVRVVNHLVVDLARHLQEARNGSR